MNTGLANLARSHKIRLGIGLVISALFLYLAARDIDFSQVLAVILETSPTWIGLALLSVGINTAGKVLRWRVLLSENRNRLSFSQLLAALLIGQMLNTLVPARLGDFSRAYTIGGLGPGRPYTLGTVIIEKIVDLLAYGLLILTLLLWIPLPDWISNTALTLSGSALAFAGLVLLLTHYRARLLAFLAPLADRFFGTAGRRGWEMVQNGIASTQVLEKRPVARNVILWTLLIWGTAILNNQLVLAAMNIQLPITAAILLLVALTAGISLPAGPGRIGVFEYLCVLALGVFRVDQATAFGYGVLLHAIVLLPTTAMGMVAFWLSDFSDHPVKEPNLLETP
jgi:uncharacterized membrane protein YbhN (UPF0104 family)